MFRAVYYPVPICVAVVSTVLASGSAFAWAFASSAGALTGLTTSLSALLEFVPGGWDRGDGELIANAPAAAAAWLACHAATA